MIVFLRVGKKFYFKCNQEYFKIMCCKCEFANECFSLHPVEKFSMVMKKLKNGSCTLNRTEKVEHIDSFNIENVQLKKYSITTNDLKDMIKKKNAK